MHPVPADSAARPGGDEQDDQQSNGQHACEHHRHRYEVNPDMIEALEEAGLKFVGRDPEGQRMEIMELDGHPFYFGTQYHPEFKSRPNRPSPPFLGLLKAAVGLPI